ncbi:MAG: DUF971 domain-containing protein [Bacteroidota bacterium]|nr:DUF971 domain-containing protein [Bacteroidota bacterium]
MSPVKIKIKDKKVLYLKWDDNTESFVKLTNLRRACPCALCKEERERLGADYIPLYNDNQVTITNIKIVGYYALNITWKDGHSTGIYEYERLRQLGESSDPLNGLVA